MLGSKCELEVDLTLMQRLFLSDYTRIKQISARRNCSFESAKLVGKRSLRLIFDDIFSLVDENLVLFYYGVVVHRLLVLLRLKFGVGALARTITVGRVEVKTWNGRASKKNYTEWQSKLC